MTRIVLGTRSEGKLRELRPLFGEAGLEVVDLGDAGIAPSPDEDEVESFETFEENALAKARYYYRRAGLPVVADDSGIEVAALGGAPGVRSRRWSGRRDLDGPALDDANNAKLLAELARAGRDRTARYVCVAAYVDAGGVLITRGTTAGRIGTVPRGGGGFGYDPLFVSDELGMTFGEATREAKERVSHRGRAFRSLIERIRETRPATSVANDAASG